MTMSVLKHIQDDLIEADVNGDGRIDFEELKLVLRKYPESFSPSDIDRVGELFFVGQGGGSIRHSTFLRGVQHVLKNGLLDSSESPIQMTSLDDQRCWVSPEEAKETDFFNVQAQFDQSLSDYVQEVKTEEEEKDTTTK